MGGARLAADGPRCAFRGAPAGDTSGIRDSVVNQLLAIMDGVDALNNILVIGLTNRRELMDPALLRPGRLEVQVRTGARALPPPARAGLPWPEGRFRARATHGVEMRAPQRAKANAHPMLQRARAHTACRPSARVPGASSGRPRPAVGRCASACPTSRAASASRLSAKA